jgi:site-specific recombinase XerD
MTTRSAGKYWLLAHPDGWEAKKAPRCTAEIARLYRRKEGLSEGEIWRLNRRRGRSAEVYRVVRERLRPLTPAVPTPNGVRADRYLADAVHRWIIATCRSPDSWRKYVEVIARWIGYRPRGRQVRSALHQQLLTVPADVLDWLRHLEEELTLTTRSIALHRDVLRSWFRWLYERELVARVPITREAINGYRVQHERVERGAGIRDALTPEQGNKLAEWAMVVARPVQGVAVLLELSSMLRSVEVERLERRQLVITDTERHLVVRRGKGDRQRTLPLEQIVVDAWQRYASAERLQGDRGPLLRKSGGGRYARRTIQAWAKRALRYAGRADLSSHDLRRSGATLLVENGGDLLQAQRILGHARLETTRRCYVVRQKPITATTGIRVPA